ncbi:hypothetical protein SSX86_016229 [Deinandra increscens subsp. villosa]|uniref:Uncharacterized protein n=1 Tax=Deinandra increscens subsp. villosa TaxID=3103831 RepID=A0AAP0D2W6_9ASTR
MQARRRCLLQIEAQRSAKWIFQLKNGERFGNDSIKFTVNNVFQAAAPTPLALTAAGTSGESKLCITEGDKKPVRRQLFVEGETDVEGKQQISANAEQENAGKMKALLEEAALGKQPAVVPVEQTMSPKRKAPVKQGLVYRYLLSLLLVLFRLHAMAEGQRISQLRHNSDGGPLDIRVLMVWRPKNNNPAMRYLLVDEFVSSAYTKHGSFSVSLSPVSFASNILDMCARQGDAIEAIFNINEKIYLEPRLAIMGCYTLTNYTCTSAPDFYRIAPHTAALYIDRNLNARRLIDNFSIPWKYFNFLPFNRLREQSMNHEKLTDYIGKVTHLEEKQISDRSPVLMMTLQEPGPRAVVMKLSESIYTEINLENITTMDREVIVAATALKVVPAPGKPSLHPDLKLLKLYVSKK